MNTSRNTWQLQTAKNKFSEVINHALSGQPQLVTRHGKPSVYVVSVESYEKSRRGKKASLKTFLLNSPFKDIEIDTSRDKSDSGRGIDL